MRLVAHESGDRKPHTVDTDNHDRSARCEATTNCGCRPEFSGDGDKAGWRKFRDANAVRPNPCRRCSGTFVPLPLLPTDGQLPTGA